MNDSLVHLSFAFQCLSLKTQSSRDLLPSLLQHHATCYQRKLPQLAQERREHETLI